MSSDSGVVFEAVVSDSSMNPAVAVQILSFGGDDVFQLDVALHNDATAGQKYLDMHAFDVELSLRTGRVKVVFLNKFVQNLLVRTLHKYQSISMNRLCFQCFHTVGWAWGRAYSMWINWVMWCWCGYLSRARYGLFAYCLADTAASHNPIISCLI